MISEFLDESIRTPCAMNHVTVWFDGLLRNIQLIQSVVQEQTFFIGKLAELTDTLLCLDPAPDLEEAECPDLGDSILIDPDLGETSSETRYI